jgi:hypothetical protein
MSTVTSPDKPRQSKPLQPVEGGARLLRPVGSVTPDTGEIRITAQTKAGLVVTDYYLTLTGTGFRLTGFDRKRDKVTVYDLPTDLSSCDCPDSVWREERPGGCKHRRGLAALKREGKL